DAAREQPRVGAHLRGHLGDPPARHRQGPHRPCRFQVSRTNAWTGRRQDAVKRAVDRDGVTGAGMVETYARTRWKCRDVGTVLATSGRSTEVEAQKVWTLTFSQRNDLREAA